MVPDGGPSCKIDDKVSDLSSVSPQGENGGRCFAVRHSDGLEHLKCPYKGPPSMRTPALHDTHATNGAAEPVQESGHFGAVESRLMRFCVPPTGPAPPSRCSTVETCPGPVAFSKLGWERRRTVPAPNAQWIQTITAHQTSASVRTR